MENQNNFYSVSDLAAKLEVPRTTINDWLKKFDRYIDFEVRGRRKVYTEASLDVLKIISASKDKGQSVAELEKELAAKCAIRPEISPMTDEQDTPAETPIQESDANLPSLPASPDMMQALQQVFERCGQDLEKHARAQEHIRRRGFLLVSVLLVLLLGAACATLLLLGQLLTLKESSKTLEMRLAASKEETQLLRQNTRKEFQVMAAKVDSAGRSNTQAVAALQEKLTAQRRQFEKILAKLEQADKHREKEILRLEKELARQEQNNSRLKNELAGALKKIAYADKKLAASQKQNNALAQKNTGLNRRITALEQQNALLSKKLKDAQAKNKAQQQPRTVTTPIEENKK